MKEETERKKYRELSIAEITKFIKLMSKKKFKYEDYVKSEEDWWDLTNFVAQFGNNNSPRTMWLKLADKNEATREWLGEYSCGDSGLESAIADIFFSSEGGQSSYRNYWPQGRRQSFTYKYNRIISAIQHFHRMELRNPDRDHGASLDAIMTVTGIDAASARAHVGARPSHSDESHRRSAPDPR